MKRNYHYKHPETSTVFIDGKEMLCTSEAGQNEKVEYDVWDETLMSIVSIFAFLSISSCNVIEQDTLPHSEPVDVTFVASFDNKDKTVLQPDGNTIYWSPNDSIKVFQGNRGSSKFVSNNLTAAESAEFSGSLNVLTGSFGNLDPVSFWAVYPYRSDAVCDGESVEVYVPDVQTAMAGGFQPGCFPAIAKSGDLNLKFRNAAGGLVFTVSENGIQQFSIRGNNSEVLAGKAMVGFDDNYFPEIKTVTEGKKVVRINAPRPEGFVPGVSYYVVTLPAELTTGFLMTFSKESSEGIFSTKSSVAIKRNVFSITNNYDAKATYKKCVDLGFGVKWATENIGADSDQEYGDYYAWGETKPKSSYYWGNYKFFNIEEVLLKYNTLAKYGTVDNKTVLDASDDAATVNWGEPWRTPTKSEWAELAKNCSMKIDTVNNVVGWRVTGKKAGYTGNSIFLPFTNVGDSDAEYRIYQTSNIAEGAPKSLCYVNISATKIGTGYYGQRNSTKCKVRPVTSSSPSSSAVDLGLSVKWASMNLNAVTPEGLGNSYYYGHTEMYESGQKYKYYRTDTTITKYNNITEYGIVDNKKVLDPEDDAAVINWGGNWRMPSKAEFELLFKNCTCEWVENGDVKGYKFTSKVLGYESRYIFLRAAANNAFAVSEKNNSCRYWTSNVMFPSKAGLISNLNSYFFEGLSDSKKVYGGRRYLGRTIRPVLDLDN